MDNLAEMMGGSWYDSKWFKIFSYIGIFVGLFYLIAGILLLLRKEYAIKTVIAALCVSIVFSLAKMFAMSSTESSLFAAVSNFGFIFSIAIDIGLLIAIFTIDKSNYLKRDVAEA